MRDCRGNSGVFSCVLSGFVWLPDLRILHAGGFPLFLIVGSCVMFIQLPWQ